LELIKDYDLDIQYHLGNANLVADALSRKGQANMALTFQLPEELMKEFEKLNLGLVAHFEGVTLKLESTLEQKIREGQLEDVEIREIRETMERGKAPDFTEDDQGMIWFKNRICVPDVGDVRKTIVSVSVLRCSEDVRRPMIQLIPFTQAVLRCISILSRSIGGMG
jgi:hypothetical protein